jgi:hypothetical protein
MISSCLSNCGELSNSESGPQDATSLRRIEAFITESLNYDLPIIKLWLRLELMACVSLKV